MMNCTNCGSDIDIDPGFDNLDDTVICSVCKTEMTIEYDEIISDEGEEEISWFYLEEKISE